MKTTNLMKLIPVAAFVLLMSCSGEKKEAVTPVEEKTKVKLETVHTQDVDQLGEFTATVEAHISNNIAPQSPLRIEKLHAEVGDHVKAGQLLATMDATNLKQTQLQIANQEIEFKRIDELYKVGGASKSAWDAQKTSLEVSRAQLQNLQVNNQLLSPITGIVTTRNYDSGDMYNGSTPVYVVEQIRPVKLMLNVSESYFTYVKKGMDVDIKLDVYGDEIFKGKVHLVYPTVDPTTRTFPVEVRIANNDEKVRPGMFARITLSFGTLKHVVAPDQAVVKQAGSGDRYMYVYNNGKVSYNKVELGRRMGNRYEVISGVKDGDQVVITGLNRLTNGQEVEIVQ
ncbi:efflux RND transporter periplasmic adaptor subunit [Parabacteroides sp. 52]|uniref:efflux RND transporter periplasmic adaptor subunit n=1 Tax=unclassified Parabacteroides TaxID=2649774 RepID=UPI0013D38D89|nr:MULTISPECIES: efflux RND transporter periplasmic adaptor subunit [unclassified Parabacteroides]MDH6533641.1 RND family efflux transporter MFP subunit [Parabacteroides sp. PM5-20]NDV54393.1 efflux RND transporter periplasmic adaptor subunit [Parabacteroides sp. 52]